MYNVQNCIHLYWNRLVPRIPCNLGYVSVHRIVYNYSGTDLYPGYPVTLAKCLFTELYTTTVKQACTPDTL
jgi:hypothetical protein